MLNIKTMGLGPLAANCYIISDENNNCVAIDIGGTSGKFLEYIESKKLNLKAILLTHVHFDHVMGVEDVQKKLRVPVYFSSLDEKCLTDADYNASSMMGYGYFPNWDNIKYFSDGEELEFSDSLKFKVIATPGHTGGSVCFDTGKELFTGDTLFSGSQGRTDFAGGSVKSMKESLEKLKNLNGDRIVYPGHGPSSTLEYERKANPFM